MEIDPVCKMEVDPQTAMGKSEYKQKTYYFCSPGCKRSFEKDPELYLSGKVASNDTDGIFDPSLLIAVQATSDGMLGTYNFVVNTP